MQQPWQWGPHRPLCLSGKVVQPSPGDLSQGLISQDSTSLRHPPNPLTPALTTGHALRRGGSKCTGHKELQTCSRAHCLPARPGPAGSAPIRPGREGPLRGRPITGEDTESDSFCLLRLVKALSVSEGRCGGVCRYFLIWRQADEAQLCRLHPFQSCFLVY